MRKAEVLGVGMVVLAVLPAGATSAQTPGRPPGPRSPLSALKSLTGSIAGIESGPQALVRERKAAQTAGMPLFPPT